MASVLFPPPFGVIQTRRTAGWLAGELSREGHQVALLSGEMQVEQRAAVIERFKDGKEKVLVTTNVCARGNHHVLTLGAKRKPFGSSERLSMLDLNWTLIQTH